MKNFLVNIFKTLFFFDLAAIVFTLLPKINKSNDSLEKLINEALILSVVFALSIIFIFIVERFKVTIPLKKHIFKSFSLGLLSGVFFPIVCIAVMAIFKCFNYTGINKISYYYYWILALFCNVLATELLFRGYLFSLYKKFYGFTFATIATTLLYLNLNFNIFSKDKFYIINIILFNILLCFLLDYTNSFISTIIAHYVYVLISTLALGSLTLSGGYPTLIGCTFSPKKYLVGVAHPLESSALLLSILSFITILLIFKKYKPIKNIKILISKIKNLPIKRKNKLKSI